MHQQPPAQERCRAHAHVDGRRAARPGERCPVLLREAFDIVSRQHGQGRIAASPGQRHAEVGRRTRGRRDARHHLEGDACLAKRGDFFIKPSEHGRVAALETHDAPSLARVLHHQRVDIGLLPRGAEACLARLDEQRLAARQLEDAGRDEPVVDDDVGLVQQALRLARQQLGITGTGADQGHAAGLAPLVCDLLQKALDAPRHGMVASARQRRLAFAAEIARPERAPLERRAEPCGASAIGTRDARQRARGGRQHGLDTRLDRARENGRRAFRADGDDHRIAVDQGGRDELRVRRVVHDVDERARRPADRGGTSVLALIVVRAVEQRRAVRIAGLDGALDQLDAARIRPSAHAFTGLRSEDADARASLEQQRDLRRRMLARAGEDDHAAA